MLVIPEPLMVTGGAGLAMADGATGLINIREARDFRVGKLAVGWKTGIAEWAGSPLRPIIPLWLRRNDATVSRPIGAERKITLWV
jgi:hypothetical protein